MLTFLQRQEKAAAVFLVSFFFLLNLLIASRSPFGGWMDEVALVDPAWNLAVGKGWTSSVWDWQTDHEFWCINSPLFPGGLFVWIQLFGKSIVATRAYGYFLASVGLFFCWLGAFRLNLLTPVYRFYWVILLATEYGMNWMARNGRYDVWIFLALSLAWVGASIRTSLARYGLIFFGCYLVPWGGFVGCPYVFLMAGLFVTLNRLKFLKEAILACAATCLGVLSVFLFYGIFGNLDSFLTVLHHSTGLGDHTFYANFLRIIFYPTDDPSLAVMIGVLAILTFFHLRQASLSEIGKWLIFGWGVVILMPCLMLLRGVFVMMYFYFVITPVSLVIFYLILQTRTIKSGQILTPILMVIMAMTCLGGLPARFYKSVMEWKFRDPVHIRDFVRENVRPDDRVVADFFFYFELHDYAKYVTSVVHQNMMSAEEISRINVVLIEQAEGDNFSGLEKEEKAGWKKVAVYPTPEMLQQLRHGTDYKKYVLYRREACSSN